MHGSGLQEQYAQTMHQAKDFRFIDQTKPANIKFKIHGYIENSREISF
jgi:hypothetical protein